MIYRHASSLFIFINSILLAINSKRTIPNKRFYVRKCDANQKDFIQTSCSVYSHELDEIVGEDWDAVDKIFLNGNDKVSKLCDEVLNHLRNQSYIDGKSCILKIAETNCSEKAKSWLHANYDGKFLKALLTNPYDGECNSLYHELLGRQCEPECIELRGIKNAPRCRDLKNCYNDIFCADVENAMMPFYQDCDGLTDEKIELVNCMKEFYHRVYQNESNCTKYFDFLSKQLFDKRQAFRLGKSCFLDIIQNNCMDSSIKYLNHNYEKFLEILTVPAKNLSCISFHDHLMGAQCIPLQLELIGLGRKMKLTGKLEDSLEDLRAKCKEAKECMIGSRQLLASLGEVDYMCAES